jgi:hypothetical protein
MSSASMEGLPLSFLGEVLKRRRSERDVRSSLLRADGRECAAKAFIEGRL